MVALAPHLVHPLPLVVAAFGSERPDRKVGVGLNLYDVMAVERLRGRRRPRRFRQSAEEPAEWSPDRHRVIPGDEVVRLIPALARKEPSAGYLFYDCQTDDARLVLTVLGEAERFGTVMANGCEVTELVEEAGRANGVRVRDRETGDEFVVQADNVINATGVWADRLRPEELHDEAEVPNIRPSRGHPHHPALGGPAARRRRDRPRGRRAFDLRAALARSHADRDDRQRLRHRRPRPHRAVRRGHRLPARRPATTTSAPSSGRRTSPAPTRVCGR
jgi:hypothetical protein